MYELFQGEKIDIGEYTTVREGLEKKGSLRDRIKSLKETIKVGYSSTQIE
jgi:hypothetical protein